MDTSAALVMRRFASTIFVFLALLVACMGVSAAPAAAEALSVTMAQEHATPHAHAASADDTVALDDQDAVPSLEDNSNGGLDDTFDVPPLHVVSVPRIATTGHADVRPQPHAHHPSLDLRPPIA